MKRNAIPLLFAPSADEIIERAMPLHQAMIQEMQRDYIVLGRITKNPAIKTLTKKTSGAIKFPTYLFIDLKAGASR